MPLRRPATTCRIDAAHLAGLIGGASKVPCVSLTSRGSIPGSEVVTIHQLEPMATIKAFKHLHSTNTAPQDTSFPPVVINSPGMRACARLRATFADPRDPAMFPAGTSQNSVLDLSTSRVGQGGPISIDDVFRLRGGREFTFAWHNTSGALREGCALPNNIAGDRPRRSPGQPGQDAKGCFGPEVGQKLRNLMSFLGPTDVELGSVVSLGFGINGERDIVDYNYVRRPEILSSATT